MALCKTLPLFLIIACICAAYQAKNQKQNVDTYTEVYSFGLKAKQTKRVETKCPKDIYNSILKLMEECI